MTRQLPVSDTKGKEGILYYNMAPPGCQEKGNERENSQQGRKMEEEGDRILLLRDPLKAVCGSNMRVEAAIAKITF